jgi:hypothetical protein
MADLNHNTATAFDYDALILLSARLAEHAADCLGRRDVAADMQQASRVIGRLAVFKARVRDIAETWTPTAAHDLRTALDAVERTED